MPTKTRTEVVDKDMNKPSDAMDHHKWCQLPAHPS